MSVSAMASCWGPRFPANADGVGESAVRLVALAIADVVNDMHENQFYGSLPKLATKVGLSRETVRKVMRHLVETGVLDITGGEPGKTIRYQWKWVTPPDVLGGTPPDVLGGPHQTSGTDTNRTQEGTQPSRSAAPSQADEMFEKFYAAYPRKKAPGDARRAFRAAVKRDGLQSIRDGFKRMLPELLARPIDKVPYPASWLNGEEYKSEPDAATSVHVGKHPKAGQITYDAQDNRMRFDDNGVPQPYPEEGE